MGLDKLSVFKKMKTFVQQKKELSEQKHDQMVQEKKDEAIGYLEKPLSDAEVYNINLTIIFNSAGWIGGNWTERDIKLHFLRHNSHLFNDDEYQYYYDQICSNKQKTKC